MKTVMIPSEKVYVCPHVSDSVLCILHAYRVGYVINNGFMHCLQTHIIGKHLATSMTVHLQNNIRSLIKLNK